MCPSMPTGLPCVCICAHRLAASSNTCRHGPRQDIEIAYQGYHQQPGVGWGACRSTGEAGGPEVGLQRCPPGLCLLGSRQPQRHSPRLKVVVPQLLIALLQCRHRGRMRPAPEGTAARWPTCQQQPALHAALGLVPPGRPAQDGAHCCLAQCAASLRPPWPIKANTAGRAQAAVSMQYLLAHLTR